MLSLLENIKNPHNSPYTLAQQTNPHLSINEG